MFQIFVVFRPVNKEIWILSLYFLSSLCFHFLSDNSKHEAAKSIQQLEILSLSICYMQRSVTRFPKSKCVGGQAQDLHDLHIFVHFLLHFYYQIKMYLWSKKFRIFTLSRFLVTLNTAGEEYMGEVIMTSCKCLWVVI